MDAGTPGLGVTRRWVVDLATMAAGAVTLVVGGALARGSLSDVETTIFRALNDLPSQVFPAIWPLMQYGTFITIPTLTLIAFAFRRWRLGLALLIAGVGVYALARLAKVVVERPRPGGLLADVTSHEAFARNSLGFPSGHAAVASALTVVAFAFLPRRWALVALGVATVVMLGRMYVGAHLPLDLVGGAALGAIAGAGANLLVGVPRRGDPSAAPRHPS